MLIKFIYFSLILAASYPAFSLHSPDDILTITDSNEIRAVCKEAGKDFTKADRDRFVHNIELLPFKTDDDVEKVGWISLYAERFAQSYEQGIKRDGRKYLSRVSARCKIRSALRDPKNYTSATLNGLLGKEQVDLFRNNLLVLLQSHASQPSSQTKAEINIALGRAEELIANKIYGIGKKRYKHRRAKKEAMKRERRRFRKQMDRNSDESGDSSPSPTKKRRTSSSKIIQETQEVS